MSIYSEYLDRRFSFDQLAQERKLQLRRIADIRERDVIVYASDMSSRNAPTAIDRSDILPFSDQLSVLTKRDVDVILQTPGGLAETVEDIVKGIRSQFDKVGVIVPGMAYSAGTIFAMAADEILMGPTSSLGPIDAQIISHNKRFSADAFLEWLDKVKKEASKAGRLNIAYIPILQGISPGEIQHCENAQNLSKTLVTEWLKRYKFKFWNTHKSTKKPVSPREKATIAKKIAAALCNQSIWLTHGRSIKIDDLTKLGLQITDYSANRELFDAIYRYHVLLQMSLEANIYKIYETPISQIYRTLNTPVQMPPMGAVPCSFELHCNKCGNTQIIQIDFGQKAPMPPGSAAFPENNVYKCTKCQAEHDLTSLRQQIEAASGKKIQ